MADYWSARWRDDQIAFHEGKPNALLDRHAPHLAGARRVLVPLCGKAVDLAYLAARGHAVVGVELVEQAVRAFFDERTLTPTVEARGPFTAYAAGPITLLVGDIFAATRAELGEVDALYDRAALIALPDDVRGRYVDHLRALLPVGAPGLVITLDYDASRFTGPPFAVGEAEVRARFAGCEVEQREVADNEVARDDLRVPAIERCFAVRLGPAG